jgi:hypothetical protein
VHNPGAEDPTSTSVAAAALLLGYGWGKPPQIHSGEDGGDIRITIRKMLTEGDKDE